MNLEKIQKIEKISGYTLTAIGLIFIIVTVLLGLWIYMNGAQISQLVPIPAGETSEFVKSVVVFSNVCLVVLMFVIMVWAGSIISSRGVTMIKDVKLKLVKKNIEEAEETARKIKKSD
jgi:ABC-type lipoprotein release transport system permease subunit